MTRPERIDETIQVTKYDLMRMLTDDEMKSRRQTRLQEMLKAELDQAQRAEKKQRTSGRLGYAGRSLAERGRNLLLPGRVRRGAYFRGRPQGMPATSVESGPGAKPFSVLSSGR